ncbi:uncharacterized protein Dwil_GK16455 [Drosophila willistoni]|uniref:Cilia- and flagella-associated protein 299 n=1 Tax=Drosophila willistoni TaxID=7260 RepID=B4N289_DROWI|nr:cilia- and flagella-associated protein 299 [Drosophila willistoni]EDW78478.1 uncharacterized protein Dwil_GK16455 [Drosophila willistoni]
MQAIDIDYSLQNFETYREYLDSFKLPEDSRYMRSSEIIKLGYRSQKPIYTTEEFYMRRENLAKQLNSKILDISFSTFFKGNDAGLMALAAREKWNVVGRLSTIIFLQMRQHNGFDISGYIDFAQSLRNWRLRMPDSIDWKAIFEARILLRPRNKDLCFFDWHKGKITSNDTDNFQTMTHPDYGLCFKHKGDHKYVQVTSTQTPTQSGNVTRTMVKSKLYGIIILYDHEINSHSYLG